MTLDQALDVLIQVHTRDDNQVGFVIEIGASPDYRYHGPISDYYEAWRTVRNYNHFRTEPEHYPVEKEER